jgi:hypothetical protein
MTGFKSKKAAAQDKLNDDDDIQVYKRPWVDLTDEQIADYLGDEYHAMTESELRFFRLGEAAAKEKNND